jgi:hypothetical protein
MTMYPLQWTEVRSYRRHEAYGLGVDYVIRYAGDPWKVRDPKAGHDLYANGVKLAHGKTVRELKEFAAGIENARLPA